MGEIRRSRLFFYQYSFQKGRYPIFRSTIPLLLVVLFLLRIPNPSFGFVPMLTRKAWKTSTTKSLLVMQYIPDNTIMTAITTTTTETTMLSSINNLRQYVPLVVSVFVILDILLGSPMANSVLNQIRPNDGTNEEVNDNISNNNNNIPVSKERIDSQKVAQEAIQRARYTMELRTFLDAQRDPVVELQRQMDQQAALLEQNQSNLQAALRRQSQPSQPSSNDNDMTNSMQK